MSLSGKLGFSGVGSFKLGDSVVEVCFTYQGDDTPTFTYQGDDSDSFTYQGDDTPTFTYQGEC